MQTQPFLDRLPRSTEESGTSVPYIPNQRAFAAAPSYGTPIAGRRNDLLRAAQHRDSSRLRWLVTQSLQDYDAPQLDEAYALHYVSWIGDINDLVEPLLQQGANPYTQDMNGDSAIHYAVRGCNLKLLKFYYRKFGDEIFALLNNSHFNVLLTCAAETHDDKPYELLHIVEWMYLRGSSLECQDAQGKTALLWAAQRGSVTLVQYLLSRCANLAHRDHMGRTALHLACTSGDEETVLMLCEKGALAFIDASSNDGGGSSTSRSVSTPLKICWSRGHYFLGLSLRQWEIQRTLFGTCTVFRNSYAWYFQALNTFNLLLFGFVAYRFLLLDAEKYWPVVATWTLLWVATNLCWFIAFFSNPGFAKLNVIPSQSTRCSSDHRRDVFAKWMSVEGDRTQALEKLHQVERDLVKIGYDLCLLNQKWGVTVHDQQAIPPEVHARYSRNAASIQKTRDTAVRLMPLVASARCEAVPAPYRDAVLGDGPSKKICITCRILKPFRAHHCSDCAHCVNRFDHHCIWLDNCVGIGNQRSFFMFLVFLTQSFIFNWIASAIFIRTIASTQMPSDVGDTSGPIYNLLTEPLVYFLLPNGVLNVLWFGFVAYLLLRTSKGSVTNLTFYEYLKKPVHVVRRYNGQTNSPFWEWKGLTPAKLVQNCYSFFTLSDKYDIDVYPEAVEADRTLQAAARKFALQKSQQPSAPHEKPAAASHHHNHHDRRGTSANRRPTSHPKSGGAVELSKKEPHAPPLPPMTPPNQPPNQPPRSHSKQHHTQTSPVKKSGYKKLPQV